MASLLRTRQIEIKWGLRLLILLFGVGLAAITASQVRAQTSTTTAGVSDDQVNAIARQLYCPVCENIPLDVCPTTACAQWRELIRQMIAEGDSVDYIKNYFVVHYGTRVLAEPPGKGINLMIYILPPLMFLAGAFLVYRMLRKVHKPAQADTPPVDNLPQQMRYVDQIEKELRERN